MKDKKTKNLEKKKARRQKKSSTNKEPQSVVISPVKREISTFYEIKSDKIKCQFCGLGKNSGDLELGKLIPTYFRGNVPIDNCLRI